MLIRFINHLKGIMQRVVRVVSERLVQCVEPGKETLVGGVVGDMAVSKRELIAENALLRQQVIVLQRQVKRPRLKDRDRLLLVLLASRVRAWRQAVLDSLDIRSYNGKFSVERTGFSLPNDHEVEFVTTSFVM